MAEAQPAAVGPRTVKVHCLVHDGADARLRALWAQYGAPTEEAMRTCTCAAVELHPDVPLTVPAAEK